MLIERIPLEYGQGLMVSLGLVNYFYLQLSWVINSYLVVDRSRLLCYMWWNYTKPFLVKILDNKETVLTIMVLAIYGTRSTHTPKELLGGLWYFLFYELGMSNFNL